MPLDHLYEKIVYGEGQALGERDDKSLNLRAKPFLQYDSAGKMIFEYDFKGNLCKTQRRLAANYKITPNWAISNPDSLLQVQAFSSETEYDALNRGTRC